MAKRKKKRFIRMIEEYQRLIALILFGVIEIALILCSILALHIPPVPVCVIALIEVLLAIELHGVELWIHGVAMLIELIAGILCGKIIFILVMIAVYIAATCFLQFFMREKD